MNKVEMARSLEEIRRELIRSQAQPWTYYAVGEIIYYLLKEEPADARVI